MNKSYHYQYYLSTLCSLWNLSSLTRDWNCAPEVEVQSLIHWATREFLFYDISRHRFCLPFLEFLELLWISVLGLSSVLWSAQSLSLLIFLLCSLFSSWNFSSCTLDLFTLSSMSFFFLMFIYFMHWVLVVIFYLSCGIWDLYLLHVRSSSPTRDYTQVPSIGSAEP